MHKIDSATFPGQKYLIKYSSLFRFQMIRGPLDLCSGVDDDQI